MGIESLAEALEGEHHEIDEGIAASGFPGCSRYAPLLKTVVNCAPTTWNELSPEGPASSTHRRTRCPAVTCSGACRYWS
jgi:hypothetical protein